MYKDFSFIILIVDLDIIGLDLLVTFFMEFLVCLQCIVIASLMLLFESEAAGFSFRICKGFFLDLAIVCNRVISLSSLRKGGKVIKNDF